MFSRLATIVGAGALLFSSLVAAQQDPRCQGNGDGNPEHPWTDVHYIGKGEISNHFCHTQSVDGVTITGIEAWANNGGVQALQFYYSDGSSSGQIGKFSNGGTHQRFDWDYSKETVQQVKLWGNGKGTALGRILVRTSTGNQLEVGKDVGDQNAYDIKVNAGILLGAYGGSQGSSIEGLGLLFLKSKGKSMTIDEMKVSDSVEQLNEKMQGLKQMTDYKAHYAVSFGNLTSTSMFAMDATRIVTKTVTISNSNTFTIGHDFSFTAKVPEIAEATTGWSLEYSMSHEESEANMQSDQAIFKYSISVASVGAQEIWCQATAWFGEYEAEWQGIIKITLEDGDVYSYKSTGTVKQTKWGQVNAACQDHQFDEEFPDAPAPDTKNPTPTSKRAVAFIG